MKKFLFAFTLTLGLIFGLQTPAVQAISYPELDLADFRCRTNDPSVVDAQISFTQSTAHTNGRVTIIRGGVVLANMVSLPPNHEGFLTFGFSNHQQGDVYAIIYHNMPKLPGIFLGEQTPTNCPAKN